MRRLLKICRQLFFKNHLGMLLVVGNIGFTALNYAVYYISALQHGGVYTHIHGADCLTVSEHRLFQSDICYNISPLQMLWNIVNLPAIALTKLSTFCLEQLFPQMCIFTMSNIENWTVIFFVTVQWLLIGRAIKVFLKNKLKLL